MIKKLFFDDHRKPQTAKRKQAMELLTDLHANGKFTILMVTHSDYDVSSQRIILMKDGGYFSEKHNQRMFKV
jgi:energy-coupling factor transporter ATP-binding protein EcfA2